MAQAERSPAERGETETRRRAVAIVTDSAAALPPEMTAEHRVTVARMEVTINGETFVDGPANDGAGDSLADFYSKLRTAEVLPTTAAPRPAEWLQAIQAASQQADAVLCITLSKTLSAAYDAARVAAEMAEEELPGTTVSVFDSRAAAGSEALVVLEAARLALDGKPLVEILERAEQISQRVRLVAYLDTLHYIHRSGRVPKIAVWATSLLNIKPVMEFSADRVGAIARPRSRSRAFKRLVREATTDLQGRRAHVNVMHADAREEAESLLQVLGDSLDCREIFLTQFHPFMGAHTGPGLVAVSYWAE